MQRRVLLVVMFASGLAAIIYQIIWQRLLTFVTGADAPSVTIIVAVFMAGLGIGSLAGARVADGVSDRRRLQLLAGCEAAIALFGVISIPFFYDFLYTQLGARELSPVTAAALQAAATLWPTFFMGMSFPLMTRAIKVDAREPAKWVPLLFGWNTLGAAAGAFATTTWLMPVFGFAAMTQLGGAINFACAAAVFVLSRSASPETPPPARQDTARRPAILTRWLLLFGLSGFTALALEIVWFRIMGVVLKADARTFGWLLTLYLGGLGAGALAGRLPFLRRWPASASYLLLQAAIPAYSAAVLGVIVTAVANIDVLTPLIAYLHDGVALRPELALSETAIAIGWLIPLALMSLPTFLMGISFDSLQRAAQSDPTLVGRHTGWLQAANIGGSVAGALIAGFVLIDGVGTPGILQGLVIVGGIFLWRGLQELGVSPATRVAATAALIAIPFVALPDRESLWAFLHGTSKERSIVTSDRSGIAVIRPNEGGATLLVNGAGQASLPFDGFHVELGTVPTMLHPAPRRIAIIGLGSGTTTFAAGGRRETERIDTIEIVGPVLAGLQRYRSASGYAALDQLLRDPRMHFEIADGRTFLARSTERYDVIEADARLPRAAYANNLYSVEYFALLRSRLNEGGFAVSWLPTPRVRESMRQAFPHLVVWGELGIGSERPIAIDPEAIRGRIADPFTQNYFRSAGIDPADTLAFYLGEKPERFSPADPRPRPRDLNLDRFPRDEFDTVR
jgi:spermidine synthase